jgi:thiosulfate/3-mercaptopyruvate sulfurtransferase
MFLRGAVLVASAWLALFTPGQSASAPAKPGEQPVIVPMEWLNAHLNDPAVVVIDADGETDAFRRAHIPRAGLLGHMDTIHDGHRAVPPATLARLFGAAGARDDARIVLYGGDPMSVGWMYGLFASLGHADHVSLLDGNLDAWRAAKYPVATGAPAVAAGNLSVKTPLSPVVVDGPWVRQHLQDSTIGLADVRSPEEWKKGMIPGAVKVRWEDFYSNAQLGRLKSPDEIRQVFERAGLGGRTVVTYCAVGMRASLAYFAARAAGLPVLLYQGSMSDWEAHPDYPQKR